MGPRERHMRSRSKTHIVPVIIFSILGFFLLAGVAFGVGMIGNVNRWLSDLPDYSNADLYLVSEPSTVLDANGNELASFYTQNRESVTQDQVSQYVLDGTVATEDERFYEHGGIDLVGIARAVVVQLTGGSEGASTITQQLVRNTILSEEQFDKTIERKVREAYLAIKMEEIFSKDEILMMYLNTIYYGHGAYGIQAAAHTYLGKSVSDLTLAEAALLVGLPNAPSLYDPTVNPDLALQRRNTVLARMLRNGKITQEEYDAAQAEPINLNVTEVNGNGISVYAYPYLIDYVKSQLSDEFSYDMLFKGGLTIKTTIDPTVQDAAENAAQTQLSKLGLDELQIGMTVVDAKTGAIKGMFAGRDYNADTAHRNWAIDSQQTGSSFKAFTLATAIKEGMSPDVTVNANSPLKWDSKWTLGNYANTSYGNITLARATAVSSNTAYVQVQEAVGTQKIVDLCKKMGIDIPANYQYASMTLGTTPLNTVQMASAYATFANGGTYNEAYVIDSVSSRDGKELYKHEAASERVLDAGVAEAVTNVLEGVITGGTGTGARLSVNQPVAGKSGTTDDAADLYWCGYTPQYSVAVWAGYSDNRAIQLWGRDALGTDINQPIFKMLMDAILANTPREEFPTGTAPNYKDNKSWKFRVQLNAKTVKTEASDTEDDIQADETSENTATDLSPKPSAGGTDTTTGGNTGTDAGGNSDGGTSGGDTDGGTDPTPTPTPTPSE